jgi:hypothetical protein
VALVSVMLFIPVMFVVFVVFVVLVMFVMLTIPVWIVLVSVYSPILARIAERLPYLSRSITGASEYNDLQENG